MSERLRLGMIGGGINSAVGYAHYAACRLDGRFEVVAGIFSRDEDVNQDTGEKYDAVWVSSIFELLQFNLDAVVVLTPTPSHFEIVKELLLADIPVICEKALTSNLKDAQTLIDIKNERNGFLAITYNYSGYPMARELRHMVQNGAFGKILSIQAEMPQESYLRVGAKPQEWRLKDGEIPAVHLDLGTHLHHLINFITGDYPVQVIGLNHSYSDFDVIDDVSAIAEYSTGFNASLWFGKTMLGFRNGLKIRINGTHGSAEWTQTNPEELFVATNKGQRGILDRSSPESLIASQPRYQRFKSGHPAGYVEALANLYDDFADALSDDGKVPQLYSAEVAYNGLDMMSVIAETINHE